LTALDKLRRTVDRWACGRSLLSLGAGLWLWNVAPNGLKAGRHSEIGNPNPSPPKVRHGALGEDGHLRILSAVPLLLLTVGKPG
jgi:hypothetical protein